MIRPKRLLILACFFGSFCILTLISTSSNPTRPKLITRSYATVENDHTNQILRAIRPSVDSVVQPYSNETIIAEPKDELSCQDDGAPHYILLMFITAPDSTARRQVIREYIKQNLRAWEEMVTRENPEYEIGWTIRALFFVGRPGKNSVTTLSELKREAVYYGDMVIDDFTESYLNLTVKTLRMLKWVERKCAHIPYLVKVDDDVYLNMPRLLRFLRDNYNATTGKDLIAGHKYENIRIDDNPYSKWYTPPSLWNHNQGRFPNFVSGVCYILGSNSRKLLYQNALHSKLFHLEDVFLTGIVREQSLPKENEVTDIPGIHVGWYFYDRWQTPCTFVNQVVAIHPMSSKQMRCYSKMYNYCEETTSAYIPVYFLC